MPIPHPFPHPFDHVNMVCPVDGALRYGASLARVQTIRERGAQLLADPDIKPGALVYEVYDSPTCGTVTVYFKQGVIDQGDGLPSIWDVKNHGVEVPTIGHRHIRRGIFDQTGIGTTPADVANFGVAVAAGQQMHFDLWLPMTTSAASVSASVSCNGPAASLLIYETQEWASSSGQPVYGGATTYDTFGSNTTGNGAVPKGYRMKGSVVFAADGIWIPRVRAEPGSGGTCSVLRGGMLEFDLI